MQISYYKKISDFISKYRFMISILTPTYMIYSYLKNKMTNKEDKYILANDIKKFFLAFSVYTLASLCIIDSIYVIDKIDKLVLTILYIIGVIVSMVFIYNFNNRYSDTKINKSINIIKQIIMYIFTIIPIYILICVIFRINIIYKDIVEMYIFSPLVYLIIIYILAISRPLHFILVFIPDILKKIEKPEVRSGIAKARLLLIAIGSYINIIIDYSILYYFISKLGVHFDGFTNIIDVLLKTLGCGDLEPISIIAKILIIMQSVSTTILITGNLAMYINMNTKPRDLKKYKLRRNI